MKHGVTRAEDSALCRAAGRHRARQRRFSLRAAMDSDRHLAGDRVRPAQRPLPQAGAAGLGLLSALSHRRHHGPADQRPECRAHDAGPGADVQRQHGLLHRRRAVLSAAHQPLAHAGGAGADAAGQHPGAVLRQPDSRPLRAHPGQLLRDHFAGAGELLRRAAGPRLCPRRVADRPLRTAQSRSTSRARCGWCN